MRPDVMRHGWDWLKQKKDVPAAHLHHTIKLHLDWVGAEGFEPPTLCL